ncbi:MAG: DNA primase, partial [Nitrosopumilaceae archaeon]
MLEKNKAFVEESFKKYYFDHFDQIHVPLRTSEREFGYQKFNSAMRRHLAIKNDKELHLLVMTQVPSDIYCSNGYYSFPNLPMAEKDWKEADLIFDIDAKDLNLPCRQDHTCIKCNDCKTVSIFQTTCPNCGSTKLETRSVTCQDCVSGLKSEVKKLVSILTEDLGIK